MVVTSSRQASLDWLDVYSEMLAIQSHSLARIRAFVAARTTWPAECEDDIHLVVGEMERVKDRFLYWEGRVGAKNR